VGARSRARPIDLDRHLAEEEEKPLIGARSTVIVTTGAAPRVRLGLKLQTSCGPAAPLAGSTAAE